MKKQLLMLLAFAFILGGCESQSGGSPKQQNTKITLTEAEVNETKDNSNAAAQILVRKAILREMSGAKYTEEEKKELNEIKENIEMEYFLNKKAAETAAVDDMEVLQVYQNNADKLKDADIVQVLPQIKEQMLLQRREEEKVKYMNSLVEKYDLNAEIRKHFPETIQPVEEVKISEEPSAEAVPAEAEEKAETK